MTDLIAEMPYDERPRERLLMHGPGPLSNAELLALVIGTGVPGKGAVQLARELLSDGIHKLGRRDIAELTQIAGVGMAKATRIAAAFELSRRTAMEDHELGQIVYAPETFAKTLMQTHQYAQEHVGVALLDVYDVILKQKTIFIGTIKQAAVSTREIVMYALLNAANGVVVYHNHPSGNPTPSKADLDFTAKVKEALFFMDIDLVDHMIVGKNRYYSWVENRRAEEKKKESEKAQKAEKCDS